MNEIMNSYYEEAKHPRRVSTKKFLIIVTSLRLFLSLKGKLCQERQKITVNLGQNLNITNAFTRI